MADPARRWREALGTISAVATLTPEQAAELRAKWTALLEPDLGHQVGPQPGRRHIRFLFAATPWALGR